MSSELEHLLNMGFPKQLAEEALFRTGYTSLDAAVDWIAEKQKSTDNAGEGKTKEDDQHSTPQSYKCEDCQKCLQNNEELQLHSALTGHCNYTEVSDRATPLTEEERKAQTEKLQRLIEQRRKIREEQESRDELEREKMRRKQGRDIGSAKAKFETEEMRRMVEERIREKAEDKAYREKLRAEIAKEREEKKLRSQATASPPKVESHNTKPIPAASNATVCRLQIRLPTGAPMKAEFGAMEPLSAVALYIIQNWSDASSVADNSGIVLFTTFPKHEFCENELQKPLRELGLCPSAVLHAKLRQ